MIMPIARLTTLGVVAVLAAAGLVACGDDDGASSGDGTVPVVTSDASPPPDPGSAPPPSPASTAPASSGTTGAGSLTPASVQPVPDPAGGAIAPPPPGSPSGNAAAAVADLAVRQGVDPGAITVVGEENVTWPDSSLGCPEPGMAYMQVLTDGVRLVLELDGTRYEYHAGGSRPVPFFCANPSPPAPG